LRNKQAELIKQLSNRELLVNVWVTQCILVLLSAVLSFFLFKDSDSFWHLFSLYDRNILLIGIPAGLLVVLLDLFFMKVMPESYHNDGGINERIFTSMSYPMIALVSMGVSVSEEILFRGVLQTHTGLLWASAIFALVHYRYLFTPFLLISIVLLSLFIGFIFELTGNLFVTIAMHFTIDFILAVIIKKTKGNPMDRKKEYI
jgi:uncharacterized protein